MEHLIVLGIAWVLLGRWFWYGGVRHPRRLHRAGGCGGGWNRGEPDVRVGCGFAGPGSAADASRHRNARAEARNGIKESPEPPAAIAPEDPVGRLQRDWISGRITDREYEDGLDAVYGRSWN
jgi:hypothetical protein